MWAGIIWCRARSNFRSVSVMFLAKSSLGTVIQQMGRERPQQLAVAMSCSKRCKHASNQSGLLPVAPE